MDEAVSGEARNAGSEEAVRPAHSYRAYGLGIRSDLSLPELEPDVVDRPDLTIRLGSNGASLDGLTATDFQFSEDRQYLAWPQVGSFVITGTDRIDVERAREASEHLVHFPLLGPVMALLLHLRGMLVLHASAISVNGQGAIFLGDKGAGKSTTAAALVGAGHQLLTDDVLAIDFSDPAGPRIAPGFPHMKLDPGVPSSPAFDSAVTMPEPVANFPKRLHRLTEGFTQKLVPPACIYVLRRGPEAEIESLSPAEGLTALMRFSYITRFPDRPRSPADATRHFRQCAALSNGIRVARLQAPQGVERLPEAVRLIERDVAAHARAAG